MTYEEYWDYPDKMMKKLSSYISDEFTILSDNAQSLLERFKTFEGYMSVSELSRLHRDISAFERDGYTDNYQLKLLLHDLNRRKNIQRKEAFGVLMLAVFWGEYRKIEQKSISLNTLIAQSKHNVITKDTVKDWYKKQMPTGISPHDTLTVQAEYRAGRLSQVIQGQRFISPSFDSVSAPLVQMELIRAKNALLKASEGGGYHGIMDNTMTAVVGYSVIASAQASKAETYTFRATIDDRTTNICRYLNMRKLKVSDMKLGWNVPPISTDLRTGLPIPHPCRSWIVLPSPPENDLLFEEFGGIMEVRDGDIDVRIDKFTPCLEEIKTGKIVSTLYSLATKADLKKLTGWNFNWKNKELNNTTIYKLTVKNGEIQGLVALTNCERDMAVYVNIVESAPHNLGKNKRYYGVGGHLYAIAAKHSKELGYGGFLFLDAKNKELVEHYQSTLGAMLIGRPHPYRMIIDEENAMALIEKYTLKED